MTSTRLFTPSYICILAANFLLYFGFWLLIPILPFFVREQYHCTESLMGVILSCYTISALVVRPFSGFLLDAFARKPLYVFAYFVFTALFGGYLLAATLTLFILLRTAHGLAFGMVTVGGNTLVVDIMPSPRRGEGLGFYGLANNVAMSLGPMTGLFLHGRVPYSVIFLVSLVSCVLGLICASCVKKKDSLIAANKKRVEAPRQTAVRLDRFILIPGIPASIALLLLSIPYGATTNFVAMYAQQIGLQVPTGLFFTFLAVGLGIARLFSGHWVDKGYITETISYSFLLVIPAFLMLSQLEHIIHWNRQLAVILFYVIPLMQGVGFGAIFPAYNSLYINLGHHNQRATATSTYLTAWDVGIGIGISLSGVIADLSSFASIYLVGTVLSAISMIYFIRKVTPHYRTHRVIE